MIGMNIDACKDLRNKKKWFLSIILFSDLVFYRYSIAS
jgi:hypothetical protein